jgi:hypothetical protein
VGLEVIGILITEVVNLVSSVDNTVLIDRKLAAV